MNRGREQGFGCTYTLSGVWTGGSGGGGGGSNEWTSHYDYIGAPGISLSVSPNLIALTETATAKVKLHGGAEGSEYTISLASVDPVPATEPAGAVTFPDGSSVTVTTESRTGSKTVRGDRIGYLGVEASSPGAKNSPTTQPITVVGVEKLQYKVSGEGGSAEWTDVPELMYVIKGTEITFRAVRNPEGDTCQEGRNGKARPAQAGMAQQRLLHSIPYPLAQATTRRSLHRAVIP